MWREKKEGSKTRRKRERKDQKERGWQRVCVGLKSWHLPNWAAAWSAKRCQPSSQPSRNPVLPPSPSLPLFSPRQSALSLFFLPLYVTLHQDRKIFMAWYHYGDIIWFEQLDIITHRYTWLQTNPYYLITSLKIILTTKMYKKNNNG